MSRRGAHVIFCWRMVVPDTENNLTLANGVKEPEQRGNKTDLCEEGLPSSPRHQIEHLRDLVLRCLRNNILFRARHLPGLQNTSADYISRSQVENFKETFPEATSIPL